MGLEQRMDRSMFPADEWVMLKSHCFTPGKLFEPGKYLAGELPDTAFTMGLVEALPPVRGNSAKVWPATPKGDSAPDSDSPA